MRYILIINTKFAVYMQSFKENDNKLAKLRMGLGTTPSLLKGKGWKKQPEREGYWHNTYTPECFRLFLSDSRIVLWYSYGVRAFF